MSKYKIPVNASSEHATDAPANGDESHPAANGADDFTAKATTVGVVLVGAALLDAALIPGIVIGAAAIVAPKFFPKLGERLQPMFHSTVRGAYKLGRKARSAMGEVQEHMSDIAAEVHAEEAAKPHDPAPDATAAARSAGAKG